MTRDGHRVFFIPLPPLFLAHPSYNSIQKTSQELVTEALRIGIRPSFCGQNTHSSPGNPGARRFGEIGIGG